MTSPSLILLVAGAAAVAADGGHTQPPVLRPLEPADSVVFRLPIPPAATSGPVKKPARTIKIAKPVPVASPLATRLAFRPLPPLPDIPKPAPVTVAATTPGGTSPAAPAPAVKPSAPGPALPPEVAQEVAFFCQKQIGHWSEGDARKLLGQPVRTRSALDEKKRPDGKILAFHDPSGRYREIELDFESVSGALRSVFVYPNRLTWQEVRRRYQGEVSSADAPQGRKFYSYTNRRLDVLVDAQGKVISLGLY